MSRFLLLLLLVSSVSAGDTWTCPETGKQFLTGARPTPDDKLAAAPLFSISAPPPPHMAYVPRVRSMFGNDRYGVCVTSEEAFAKSCWISGVQPEIDVPEATVIDWARRRGVLHGADLGSVCDWMVKAGFKVGEQLYNDGPKALVDFRDDTALRAAIAFGPVKVSIPAHTLGGGAGTRDGWHALGGSSRGSDHCVSLCGYGTADWLYKELGVARPESIRPDLEGYLCYTWSTIGFVDPAWVKGNVREAWIRRPTTIGVPPIHPPVDSPPLFRRVLRLVVVSAFMLIAGLVAGLLLRLVWPPSPPPSS